MSTPRASANRSIARAPFAMEPGAPAHEPAEPLPEHLGVEVPRAAIHWRRSDLERGGPTGDEVAEPARRSAGPGLLRDADAERPEPLRQGARRSSLGIADVHAAGVLVAVEREGGGERDVVAGEVVLPARRPPVPLEARRRAHHAAAHLPDARGVDRLGERRHRGLADLRVAVAHDPEVPAEDAVRRRALREHLRPDPRAQRGPLQQCHGEQELLVRGRRPLDPRAVPVEPRAVEADRDGHVVAIDGLVDVLVPAGRCRDRGRGAADHDDGEERDHDGSRERGEARHGRRIRQATRRPGSRSRFVAVHRSDARMSGGGRRHRTGPSSATGRRGRG